MRLADATYEDNNNIVPSYNMGGNSNVPLTSDSDSVIPKALLDCGITDESLSISSGRVANEFIRFYDSLPLEHRNTLDIQKYHSDELGELQGNVSKIIYEETSKVIDSNKLTDKILEKSLVEFANSHEELYDLPSGTKMVEVNFDSNDFLSSPSSMSSLVSSSDAIQFGSSVRENKESDDIQFSDSLSTRVESEGINFSSTTDNEIENDSIDLSTSNLERTNESEGINFSSTTDNEIENDSINLSISSSERTNESDSIGFSNSDVNRSVINENINVASTVSTSEFDENKLDLSPTDSTSEFDKIDIKVDSSVESTVKSDSIPLSNPVKLENPTFGEEFSAKFKNELDSWNQYFEDVKSNNTSLDKWTEAAISMATPVARSIVDSGISILSNARGSDAARMVSNVPSFLANLINYTITNPIASAINDVRDSINRLMNIPDRFLGEAVDWMKSKTTGYIGGISDIATSAIDNLSRNLENRIKNLFDNGEVSFTIKKDNKTASLSPVSDYSETKDGEVKFSKYSKTVEYDKTNEIPVAGGYSMHNPDDNSISFKEENYQTIETSEIKMDVKSSTVEVPYTRLDLKNSVQQFSVDSFWNIKITPHMYNNSEPPALFKDRLLPVISFRLDGESVTNSKSNSAPGVNMAYPSRYSSPTSISVSLPEVVVRSDTASKRLEIRTWIKNYLDYSLCRDGNSKTIRYRDMRYCAYEIEVYKYDIDWTLLEARKYLGIPEVSDDLIGESAPSSEIMTLNFSIVGEDL